MNKKVKWSIISVTSASLLTFAGLVAGFSRLVSGMDSQCLYWNRFRNSLGTGTLLG